jgi:tetratricopeptide (TPR) repeat protein
MEARLARRPRSPVLLAGLTSVLLASGEAQQAADRLRTSLNAGGGPDVSRLLEKVLRDDLGRPSDADALTLKRLEGNDLTIGETLELAELQVRQGETLRASSTISAGIPPDTILNAEQGTRLLLITQQAADRALKDESQDTLAAAAGLFDLTVQRNIKFSAEMHQKRLSVLAHWSQADAPRVLAAARQAATEFPSGKGAAYVVASRLLNEAKRGPVALAVISGAVEGSKDPDLELYLEWVSDVVNDGSPPDAAPLMASAEKTGKLQEIVEKISAPKKEPPRSWRAEFLYILGNFFTAQGRPDQANQAYEMVLREDPDHAWACNNLGYALADKGADRQGRRHRAGLVPS